MISKLKQSKLIYPIFGILVCIVLTLIVLTILFGKSSSDCGFSLQDSVEIEYDIDSVSIPEHHIITEDEINQYASTIAQTEDLESYAVSMGYNSSDEFLTDIKTTLENRYIQDENYEYRENLLDAVVNASTFKNLDEDELNDYISEANEQYEAYKEYFHTDNIEDIYELFKTSPEDIENKCRLQQKRDIIISNILKEQNFYYSADSIACEKARSYLANQYNTTEDDIEKNYANELKYQTWFYMVTDYLESILTPNFN